MSWVVGLACTRLVEGGVCARRSWATPRPGSNPLDAIEQAQRRANARGWAVTRDGSGDLCPDHNPDRY